MRWNFPRCECESKWHQVWSVDWQWSGEFLHFMTCWHVDGIIIGLPWNVSDHLWINSRKLQNGSELLTLDNPNYESVKIQNLNFLYMSHLAPENMQGSKGFPITRWKRWWTNSWTHKTRLVRNVTRTRVRPKFDDVNANVPAWLWGTLLPWCSGTSRFVRAQSASCLQRNSRSR